jgi:23S rRNA (cytosine1962-C5)-methyltransferase
MPATLDLTHAARAAAFRRGRLIADPGTTCFRAFSGNADGIDGLYADALGPAIVANIYDDSPAAALDPRALAHALLAAYADATGHAGDSQPPTRAVYLKRFPRDRSRLGAPPDVLFDPNPAAGEPVDAELHVLEAGATLIVRPYDGWSTGLFLDQRANRRWVRARAADLADVHAARPDQPLRMLNAFAYTGAFGVNMALGAANAAVTIATTNADVSDRYLRWAEHNYRAAGLNPEAHHFPRADARDVLNLAEKNGWRFALIVIDPPSFGSGDKRKGVKPWRIARDLPDLIRRAAHRLQPAGHLLAATNNAQLCQPGTLDRLVRHALAGRPTGDGVITKHARFRFTSLPAPDDDVARETARVAATAITKDLS